VPSPGPYRYYPSAICVASSEGNLEVVRWLIDNGADPDLVALECLALRSAVNGGHADVVKYLLEHGADPNLPSGPDQVTTLFHCVTAHARSGRYDKDLKILRVLLETGADPKLKSGMANLTPVEHAKDQRSRIAAQPASASNLELMKKLEAVITLLDKEKGAK
jgi:ankyrin repeat protein